MLALLSKSFPCGCVNGPRLNIGLFYVWFQDVPDAPIRLFSAVEGRRDAFLLLAEVTHGGRFEFAPLLFLGCAFLLLGLAVLIGRGRPSFRTAALLSSSLPPARSS